LDNAFFLNSVALRCVVPCCVVLGCVAVCCAVLRCVVLCGVVLFKNLVSTLLSIALIFSFLLIGRVLPCVIFVLHRLCCVVLCYALVFCSAVLRCVVLCCNRYIYIILHNDFAERCSKYLIFF